MDGAAAFRARKSRAARGQSHAGCKERRSRLKSGRITEPPHNPAPTRNDPRVARLEDCHCAATEWLWARCRAARATEAARHGLQPIGRLGRSRGSGTAFSVAPRSSSEHHPREGGAVEAVHALALSAHPQPPLPVQEQLSKPDGLAVRLDEELGPRGAVVSTDAAAKHGDP